MDKVTINVRMGERWLYVWCLFNAEVNAYVYIFLIASVQFEQCFNLNLNE